MKNNDVLRAMRSQLAEAVEAVVDIEPCALRVPQGTDDRQAVLLFFPVIKHRLCAIGTLADALGNKKATRRDNVVAFPEPEPPIAA